MRWTPTDSRVPERKRGTIIQKYARGMDSDSTCWHRLEIS